MAVPAPGKLGFGCMRLPMCSSGQVDIPQASQMTDAFLAAGFSYFDVAHGYLKGACETAVHACLTSRYPRSQYLLADKLTRFFFQRAEDIRPHFAQQLEACGVDYFDVYLMHNQGAENFRYFRERRAYETALALREEGKIRCFGISFHDTPQVLEEILRAYPQIEVVQLQLNYLDWEDPAVQSRRCWEVCRQYGKPVLVMEPLKGGRLTAALPQKAQDLLRRQGCTPAAAALRWAASQEGVLCVLSGMSSLGQMEDNLRTMRDFHPLNPAQEAALDQVRTLLRSRQDIPCTNCRYCTDVCPKGIPIPALFAAWNARKLLQDPNAAYYYEDVYSASGRSTASDCIQCGACESVCPQHLSIRTLLQRTASGFFSD